MKKKNVAVFIYVPLLALLIALTGFLLFSDGTWSRTQSQEQVIDLDEYFQTEQIEEENVRTADEKNVALPTETTQIQADSTGKNGAFVLGVVDGHVAVFESGETEVIYLYTGILLENLPQSTQKEVLEGKEIADVQELYFFLEQYYL
ncbi:MAG: hypothetical protein LUC95_01045 [Lachnospiraceae bacterium]|nr:hypothetical protein [Lachnospiraceae bacterium]